jgi:hypothetical protein
MGNENLKDYDDYGTFFMVRNDVHSKPEQRPYLDAMCAADKR